MTTTLTRRASEDRTPVLEVRNLSVTYKSAMGPVKAVDNVSFIMYKGEVLGLAG
jgi:peptide/nickel transport system ATP-binding protein